MPTTVYVARSLGVDTDLIDAGGTLGTIVGGDTALTTDDGDTSYILIARDGTLTGGTEHTQMPFRWERVSGSVPSPSSVESITVEGVLRQDDTNSSGQQWGPVVGSPGAVAFVWFNSSTVSGYITRTSSVSPSAVGSFAPDVAWVLRPFVPDLLYRTATRVTLLRAVIEHGEPRLRQRNRDDLRARNRASRQRGLRARGYV